MRSVVMADSVVKFSTTPKKNDIFKSKCIPYLSSDIFFYNEINFSCLHFSFFFLNDAPPTEIYPFPLHAALPIPRPRLGVREGPLADDEPPLPAERVPPAVRGGDGAGEPELGRGGLRVLHGQPDRAGRQDRSEEHTSELQSQSNLVCRLLLEKKKT